MIIKHDALFVLNKLRFFKTREEQLAARAAKEAARLEKERIEKEARETAAGKIL